MNILQLYFPNGCLRAVVPGFLREIGRTLEKNVPELASNVFQPQNNLSL